MAFDSAIVLNSSSSTNNIFLHSHSKLSYFSSDLFLEEHFEEDEDSLSN